MPRQKFISAMVLAATLSLTIVSHMVQAADPPDTATEKERKTIDSRLRLGDDRRKPVRQCSDLRATTSGY